MNGLKPYVICVPGTSETYEASKPLPPRGMTKLVTDLLGDEVISMSVPYTSGYGDKASYRNSVNNGKKNLVKILLSLPPGSRVYLVGYSQGATIAGDIMRDWGVHSSLGHGELKDLNITAYYGIADPRRRHADIVGFNPGGCGITGERQWPSDWVADRVHQFCAPGDIIAAADPNADLFMEASEFTNEFWIGDVVGWIGYVLAVLNTKEFQDKLKKNYPGIRGYFRFKTKFATTLNRGFMYLATQVHTQYGNYKPGGLTNNKTVPQLIAEDIRKRETKS